MAETNAHEEEYDEAMVAMLELIWGEGFLSPGGPEAVREIVDGLDLTGRTVLDVGCGLGGVDVVLAREYGCRVVGLDIERELVERARERVERAGLGDRIDLRLYAPGLLPVADASVDVVFGKGSWAHVEDKRAFFAEVYRVLRPGGWLAADDWMRGPEPYSKDMAYWFELEGLTYHMETLENYGAILRDLGFVEVELADTSAVYRAQCHDEVAKMQGPLKERMREVLGPEKQAHFIENWRVMALVLDKGELRPGRFRARKPR